MHWRFTHEDYRRLLHHMRTIDYDIPTLHLEDALLDASIIDDDGVSYFHGAEWPRELHAHLRHAHRPRT